MSAPLVSIIIPCYNAEKWVGEAIQSALDQTWDNKEIIVIDDGSTDRSLDVIKGFGDQIPSETGPNRGGCAARNRGIELARGEFIQFLDADDVLLPAAVEQKLSTNPNAATIVCSDVAMIDDPTGVHLSNFWNLPYYDLPTLLRSGCPQTAAPLYQKCDLEAIGGFREHLPRAQEYDLDLRIAIHTGKTFRSTGRIGVMIRRVLGSVSRQEGGAIGQTVRSVLLDALATAERASVVDDKLRACAAQHLTRVARTMRRANHASAASVIAAEARELSPTSWHKGAYRFAPVELFASVVGFDNYERAHERLSRVAELFRSLAFWRRLSQWLKCKT